MIDIAIGSLSFTLFFFLLFLFLIIWISRIHGFGRSINFIILVFFFFISQIFDWYLLVTIYSVCCILLWFHKGLLNKTDYLVGFWVLDCFCFCGVNMVNKMESCSSVALLDPLYKESWGSNTPSLTFCNNWLIEKKKKKKSICRANPILKCSLSLTFA